MPLDNQGNPTGTLNPIGNDLRLLNAFELFLHDAATLYYPDNNDAPRVLYQGPPSLRIRRYAPLRQHGIHCRR